MISFAYSEKPVTESKEDPSSSAGILIPFFSSSLMSSSLFPRWFVSLIVSFNWLVLIGSDPRYAIMAF